MSGAPARRRAPRQAESEGGRDVAGPRPPLARSVTQTYATNLAVAGLSFASVLIVARALGPVGRGEIALVTTIAYIASQLSTLGIEQANANFAARTPALTRRLAANSVLVAGFAGACAIAVTAALIELVPAAGGSVSAGARWLALGAVPVLILQVLLQQLVLAHYGFRVANAAWLAPSLVSLIGNGALAALGELTVGLAVTIWVAGQVMATALLATYVGRHLGGFAPADPRLARRTLGFGARAHLGRSLQLGNYRLDQWLVGAIAGSRELGLYSVAVAWAEMLYFLPTALRLVQRPDLARASSDDARRRTVLAFRSAALLTAVAALATIAAAPLLCAGVFGVEFSGSAEQLRLLALGAVGMTALKLLGNALTAQGRPLLESWPLGVAFVIMIALDLVLIPGHGGNGAAIASTMGFTAGGAAMAWAFIRWFGRPASDLVPRPADLVALRAALAVVVSSRARRGGANRRLGARWSWS